MDEKFFMEILQSREDRRDRQWILLDRYQCSLISYTLNAPGIMKDNEMYRGIHKEGMKAIIDILDNKEVPMIYQDEINKSTGREGYIAVDFDAVKVKQILVQLEESHPLGRIFDMDVFDKNHNQISRRDLNMGSRSCLLCNKDARICIREKNHTIEELYSRIEDLWKEYKNE